MGAGGFGCAALLGLMLTIAGTPGLRLRGYVSELGEIGAPWAGTYRAAILALALSLALMTVAVRPLSGYAALALGGAAPLAGVSAVVRCTPGCPLPPTEKSTPADVLHAVVSIAGFTLAACAMLVLALSTVDAVVRRLSGWTLTLMIALGVPVGVGIATVGRGVLTGVLERAMITVDFCWLVALSAILARREPVAPVLLVAPATPDG